MRSWLLKRYPSSKQIVCIKTNCFYLFILIFYGVWKFAFALILVSVTLRVRADCTCHVRDVIAYMTLLHMPRYHVNDGWTRVTTVTLIAQFPLNSGGTQAVKASHVVHTRAAVTTWTCLTLVNVCSKRHEQSTRAHQWELRIWVKTISFFTLQNAVPPLKYISAERTLTCGRNNLYFSSFSQAWLFDAPAILYHDVAEVISLQVC